MSQVLWCDIGQHPFPRGQIGSTTLKVEQQVKNQWGGYQPEDVTQDVCAACAVDAGIKRIQDLRSGISEEDNMDLAAAIRDGTAGSRFSKAVLNKVKALTGGNTADKVTQARAHGYDPDYVKWLEEQADKPIEE